jgi:hypothetical protein
LGGLASNSLALLNFLYCNFSSLQLDDTSAHDSKEGKKTIESIPEKSVGVMDRGFSSIKRIEELLGNKEKHFVQKC